VGSRPRTVYTITAKGRRALAAWVRVPASGAWLEFEPLIKVFYAEHGSKADLLATLREVREWSDRETLATAHVADEYLAGAGPFPERLPWLILVGQFLDDYLAFVARWAQWAEETVASWPDELAGAQPDLGALARQSKRAREVEARAGNKKS
jgi:PadR family transcriptional regulator, regulatory protein AphA